MTSSTAQPSQLKVPITLVMFNLLLIALLLGFVTVIGSAASIQAVAETNVTVNLALLTSIFVLLSAMGWFVWLTRRAD